MPGTLGQIILKLHDYLKLKNMKQIFYFIGIFIFINSCMSSKSVIDNLKQDFEPEKPEKDYEQIELLYGDWHADCGDR